MRIRNAMKKNSFRPWRNNSQLSTLSSQLRSESGQTLLEALIALATAVIIISALSVLVFSSLSNAQFSKNQNQATQYAQQGIEYLKNLSQTDWASFSAYNLTNYCMPLDNSLPQRIGESCGQNLGIFSREVTINQYAADDTTSIGSTDCLPTSVVRAKVTVSVGWSDNKCTSATDVYCHKVKLISCVYNSPSVPAP